LQAQFDMDLSLYHQTLPCRQRKDLVAALGKPGILRVFLRLVGQKFIIIENHDSAGHDFVEQGFQHCHFSWSLIEVNMQPANLFRRAFCKYGRDFALEYAHIRIALEAVANLGVKIWPVRGHGMIERAFRMLEQVIEPESFVSGNFWQGCRKVINYRF